MSELEPGRCAMVYAESVRAIIHLGRAQDVFACSPHAGRERARQHRSLTERRDLEAGRIRERAGEVRPDFFDPASGARLSGV
jgi:hypothetical protein